MGQKVGYITRKSVCAEKANVLTVHCYVKGKGKGFPYSIRLLRSTASSRI